MVKKYCSTSGCRTQLITNGKDKGHLHCGVHRNPIKQSSSTSTYSTSSSSLTALLLIPSTQTQTQRLSPPPTPSSFPSHAYQPYTQQTDGTIKREKQGVGGSTSIFI